MGNSRHFAKQPRREVGKVTSGYAALLEKELELERQKLKNKGELTSTPLLELRDWSHARCSRCGNSETRLNKGRYERWRYIDGLLMCDNCAAGIRMKEYLPRTIHYKRLGKFPKAVILDYEVRTGECQSCHRKLGDVYTNANNHIVKVKMTRLYRGNNEYNPNAPLEGTRELCESCCCAQQWKDGLMRSWKGHQYWSRRKK